MKKIEVCHLKPSELNCKFENPRSITPEDLDDLKKSIENLGDFGVVVIDENNSVISGTQRLKAMKKLEIDIPIVCKRLVGYTETEKKIINLRANKLSGQFIEADFNRILDEINLEVGEVSLTGFDITTECETPKITSDFTYQEQFGVIVICNDEIEQQNTYNRLLEEGYNLKVVKT